MQEYRRTEKIKIDKIFCKLFEKKNNDYITVEWYVRSVICSFAL